MRRIILYTVIFFSWLPLLTIIYLSVVKSWVYPDLLNAQFTLEFWVNLLDPGQHLLLSFGTSLLLALSIGLVSTLGGFAFSAYLALSGRNIAWLGLAFAPYLIAPVSFGALLQYYFVRLGWSGSVLGVWLAQLLFVLPYAVIFMSTFWNERIKGMYQQTRLLGALRFDTFKRVLVPLAKPWLLLTFIQCFLISWFEYGITQFIGLGKVRTLTMSTMQFVREANVHFAALASCLMVFPMIFLLLSGYYIGKKRNLHP